MTVAYVGYIGKKPSVSDAIPYVLPLDCLTQRNPARALRHFRTFTVPVRTKMLLQAETSVSAHRNHARQYLPTADYHPHTRMIMAFPFKARFIYLL